jgi:hypothetical protein
MSECKARKSLSCLIAVGEEIGVMALEGVTTAGPETNLVDMLRVVECLVGCGTASNQWKVIHIG